MQPETLFAPLSYPISLYPGILSISILQLMRSIRMTLQLGIYYISVAITKQQMRYTLENESED